MAIELNENNAELIARRFRALVGPDPASHPRPAAPEREEASVGELTEALGGSQQNVSKHLAALAAEGFVSRRKQGTSSIYRISDPGVLDLCENVCAGIESELARVGAMLSGNAR